MNGKAAENNLSAAFFQGDEVQMRGYSRGRVLASRSVMSFV